MLVKVARCCIRNGDCAWCMCAVLSSLESLLVSVVVYFRPVVRRCCRLYFLLRVPLVAAGCTAIWQGPR